LTLDLAALYLKLPSAIQDVAVSTVGVQTWRRTRSEAFSSHMELLKAAERWTIQEQRAYQEEELDRVLGHAYRTVPWYSEQQGKAPSACRSKSAVSRLRQLPFTTKPDLRNGGLSFLSKAVPRREIIWLSTSGTTGTPQRLAVDRPSRVRNESYFRWLIRSVGSKPGGWGAVFMGRILGTDRQLRKRPWRIDKPNRRVFFSSYHLSPATIPKYVAKLQELQPSWIDAYPSALYTLASLAGTHNYRLPQPEAILLSSETLGDRAREEIENQFGCPVTDFYAAAEQTAFIFQCGARRYHLHPVYGYYEFLETGLMADAESMYELVTTGFHNSAMPLLRYRTGDLVTRPECGRCDCGLHFPTIGRIVGRFYSMIKTPDGRSVAGLGPALKGLPISESQLAQIGPDTAEFRVVPIDGKWSSEIEAIAVARIRQRIGSSMRISVRICKSIPRGPNGKFPMIVNEWNPNSVSIA